MTVIIFIIVLAVLILAHEFGHFIAAKSTGTRVDAFGIGFPPKLISWRPKKSETTYSINLIPFGGFVKILGEDGDAGEGGDSARSFVNKAKWAQVWMLAAGVIFNVILAWLLLSAAYVGGVPAVAGDRFETVENPRLTVLSVLPQSPAETAGLEPGDVITRVEKNGMALEGASLAIEDVQDLIALGTAEVVIMVERGDTNQEIRAVPVTGLSEEKLALGFTFENVGIVQLPVHRALVEGAKMTGALTLELAAGLGAFLANAVRGTADLSQVAGPIGIAGYVGEAAELGFVHLMTFTAFISLNLALLNLLPFPALDGGRILFVVIEAIKGSPISPRVAHGLNTVGFAILILLMLVVTYSDIARLLT